MEELLTFTIIIISKLNGTIVLYCLYSIVYRPIASPGCGNQELIPNLAQSQTNFLNSDLFYEHLNSSNTSTITQKLHYPYKF